MSIYSSHSYDREWHILNRKAREVLTEFLVEFDPEITCTGVPQIHYVDLTEGTGPTGKEQFKGRIRLLGRGQKLNSGTHGSLPHDYVRLTIVKWGPQPDQIGAIDVGEGTELNGTSIISYKSVTIGKNVLFGPGVVIMDSDGHPVDRRLPDDSAHMLVAPVTIGDNAWIGYNSLILKGVNIGDYAVIGAGSVVHADVQAHAVVAGNPARTVKVL